MGLAAADGWSGTVKVCWNEVANRDPSCRVVPAEEGTSRVTVASSLAVLPARSVAWTTNELSPAARLTPGNAKAPVVGFEVVVAPVCSSTTGVPGSVVPVSVTVV